MESFFKPTPLFKEYILLEMIEKNPKITQRELSKILNVALSMINEYLDKAEQKGYLIKKYNSIKDIEYLITYEGLNRKKILNVNYLKSAQIMYNIAKRNIINFLEELSERVNNLMLYGAGEVAEILLNTLNDYSLIKMKVVAIIDDDATKIGKSLFGIPIISRSNINLFNPDGILIAAYGMNESIYNKLLDLAFDSTKIYHFFN